ncbi:regulatory protein ArsR [Halanaerobium hydrogeniformans]|uniref:Regulatory protein ArsR n=1 Tax=Halanaerobium hydrogeniformans TaxID=656519 RepID=E4RNQ3_HALHG|nr:metalloregulator ArsR/SmtB family transcription factor [Halanaerobium hydrogeniformans]ADQ13731.1 regulatory protein ArsR [Halanaerobium hydrogeniformans]
MAKIIELLKALGDKRRLEIIELLLQKRFCVRALAKRLDISESAVSQQLKILRETGLVLGEKKGYFVHYTVQKERLKEAAQYLYELSQKNSR